MYPSFEEMLLETDRQGRQQNYLCSEDLFQWLKKFEDENRLIPIVGDFAGPHAFKAVADFLKSNGLRLSAFYTSNVEFYLFGRAAWVRYVTNLRALPLAEDSIFIRSYFPTYGRSHPLNMPGHRSTSLVSPTSSSLGAPRFRMTKRPALFIITSSLGNRRFTSPASAAIAAGSDTSL